MEEKAKNNIRERKEVIQARVGIYVYLPLDTKKLVHRHRFL